MGLKFTLTGSLVIWLFLVPDCETGGFTCFSDICNWKCQRVDYSYGHCLFDHCLCDLNGKKFKWEYINKHRSPKQTTTRSTESLRPQTTRSIFSYENFWD